MRGLPAGHTACLRGLHDSSGPFDPSVARIRRAGDGLRGQDQLAPAGRIRVGGGRFGRCRRAWWVWRCRCNWRHGRQCRCGNGRRRCGRRRRSGQRRRRRPGWCGGRRRSHRSSAHDRRRRRKRAPAGRRRGRRRRARPGRPRRPRHRPRRLGPQRPLRGGLHGAVQAVCGRAVARPAVRSRRLKWIAGCSGCRFYGVCHPTICSNLEIPVCKQLPTGGGTCVNMERERPCPPEAKHGVPCDSDKYDYCYGAPGTKICSCYPHEKIWRCY
jgi:hypothetical protein